MTLPPLTFTNARVLTPDGLGAAPLCVVDGQIAPGRAGREIDLSGFLILPGIVDPHGDGFEHHMAPRRGAATDMGQGLQAAEAELAANGITTAMLAQFWSWEGGMRSPDFARALVAALRDHDARADLRVQLRLEIGLHEEFDAVLDFVAANRIGHVVFNDHLPHRQLAAGKRVPRLEGQALKSGRSPAAHQALLQALHDGMGTARARLPALCAGLQSQGVTLGSHDDATAAARETWRGLGARIAEFPTTREAADAAQDAGDPIVMGAPNVVRGGSHDKRLPARELLDAGACTALASDYHYPAPLGAARRLVAEGWPLERAWPLVSQAPARLLGLTDRGVLSPGKRADLVVLDPGLSRVQMTMAGGAVTYLAGPILSRVLA